MAYTFTINQNYATNAAAAYGFVAALQAAGWSMVNASDGTTVGANQITSGNSGANGFNNNFAWVRMQAPAVNQGSVVNQKREITIQRGTSSSSCRIKYSASAGFTVGGTATQTPSNTTDDLTLLGGGTDASPTFSTNGITGAADNANTVHFIVGGSAEAYGFAMLAHTKASTTPSAVFILDPFVSGSYDATNVDPAFIAYSQGSSTPISNITLTNGSGTINGTSSAQGRAWLAATGTAPLSTLSGTNNQQSAYVQPPGWGLTATGVVNPFTTRGELFNVCVQRPPGSQATVPYGLAGISSIVRWGSSPSRTTLDTGNTGVSTKNWIFFQGMWFPWGGSDPSPVGTNVSLDIYSSDMISVSSGTLDAPLSVQIDPKQTKYLLTAYDSGIAARRYWVDTQGSFRNAPTATGTYGELVILGTI